MSDPDYRYCIYCGADTIDYDTIEVPHHFTCPFKTGLYPVLPQDIPEYGFVCMDCLQPFEIGDTYVLRETEGEGVFESCCVGCGLLSAIAHGG